MPTQPYIQILGGNINIAKSKQLKTHLEIQKERDSYTDYQFTIHQAS